MYSKIVVVLFLLILVTLVGAPGSLAMPQYFTNLSAVYGDGSCGTCHVNSSGGGPLNPYGMLFESQPNHAVNASAALIAIGPPPGATVAPTATLIPTATPMITLIATETPPIIETLLITETPVVIETPIPTSTPVRTPGFGLIGSLAGLLVCAFLIKRRNK